MFKAVSASLGLLATMNRRVLNVGGGVVPPALGPCAFSLIAPLA